MIFRLRAVIMALAMLTSACATHETKQNWLSEAPKVEQENKSAAQQDAELDKDKAFLPTYGSQQHNNTNSAGHSGGHR